MLTFACTSFGNKQFKLIIAEQAESLMRWGASYHNS